MNQSEALGYCVLAPGPVNLHPEVQKILALPMIHHRTPEFEKIFLRSLQNLKSVFETDQDCFILSSAGSGGMEALLVNVLNPGDKLLAINCGKFGERWTEMARVFGADVIEHKVPWGQAVKVEDVKKYLIEQPDIKIVMCQACETSTAVLNPIQELAALISERPQTLFLVDAITALGALRLPMKDWGIDGLVGGSQKAFMLPTGLSFVSLSAKAWHKVEASNTPKFYFDLKKEKAANQKGESYFSSNVTLTRALDWVLQHWQKIGYSAHLKIIDQRADRTRRSILALGLRLVSESPSPSLTALWLPAGIDGQKLRDVIESRHRFTVMGGQDQLKGKILRIGHMGDIKNEQMIDFFMALFEELESRTNEQKTAWREQLEKIWFNDLAVK